MKKVVITGLGVMCGSAYNKKAFAEKCLTAKTMLAECTAFSTDRLSTKYFCHIPENHTDRMDFIVRSTLTEMMENAGVTKEEIESWGSSCKAFIGTLIFTANYFYQHSIAKVKGENDTYIPSVYEFTETIKDISGVQGSVEITSSACSSGTASAVMALDYIKSGICDCAILGGVDPISIVTACGFNSLKALSNGICHPFSDDRDGLNIGEGGAFFFVEAEDHAKARNARIICELAGGGLSNDAYHTTSPDPSGVGAKKAMLAALKDASMEPQDIDYVNVHGTGTLINDAMESKVITEVFGNLSKDVYISSTKAITGHCMGASGAIELAASIIAMEQGKYLPMPEGYAEMENMRSVPNISISDQTKEIAINAIMSNSFAFSGHNASVIIKKYN